APCTRRKNKDAIASASQANRLSFNPDSMRTRRTSECTFASWVSMSRELRDRLVGASARPESEGHRSLDDHLAIDPARRLQQSHPASKSDHRGLDLYDVARMDSTSVPYALDFPEVDQALAVLGFREDHDRAHLCGRFGEDRRRQHRCPVVGRV